MINSKCETENCDNWATLEYDFNGKNHVACGLCFARIKGILEAMGSFAPIPRELGSEQN